MCPETTGKPQGLFHQLQEKVLSLDSLLLVGLRTLSKFLLLAFVLLCARSLSSEDFGDFQFVDTLTVQALQLLVVVSMVVTRLGCCYPAQERGAALRGLYSRTHLKMLLAATMLALAGAVADPFMRRAFSIEARWCFAASGVTMGAYMMFCWYMGVLQVLEHFRTIGVLFLTMGLIPLAGAAALYPDGLGVIEAYAAVTAGTVIATAAAGLAVRNALPKDVSPPQAPRPNLSFAWVYVTAIGLFLFMHNMDIWTTKFFLDRTLAGNYARFEFVGKIIFMISSSLTIILFPKVGKAREAGVDPRRYLLRSLRGFAVLTAAFAVVILGMFDLISPLMFGEDLSGGIALLAIIILAKAAQSLMFILINYEAARTGGGLLPWLAAATALEAVLIMVLGTAPMAVAVAAALAASVGAMALFRQVWSNARADTCPAAYESTNP